MGLITKHGRSPWQDIFRDQVFADNCNHQPRRPQIFLNTSKSAKRLAPEIDAEKHQTEELIQWFLDTYTGDSIDREISDFEELSEEEKSLKRFQIIQDFLITGKDLPDPSYVDALSEEIYARLYES